MTQKQNPFTMENQKAGTVKITENQGARKISSDAQHVIMLEKPTK